MALTLPQVKVTSPYAADPCWPQTPAVSAFALYRPTMPALAMRAFTQSRAFATSPPGLPPFRSTSQSGTARNSHLFERFEATFKIHNTFAKRHVLKTPGLVSFTCTATICPIPPATPSARRCPTPTGCRYPGRLEPRIVEIVCVAQRLADGVLNG